MSKVYILYIYKDIHSVYSSFDKAKAAQNTLVSLGYYKITELNVIAWEVK